jgi:Zonular occludens toxin (Zot)
MPDYIVTGRKGGGKSLAMVGRLREYIERGRPVATNIDVYLRKLVKKRPTAPVYRLPDLPTVADFEAIGQVHDTGREELNGAIVLDEASLYMNARTWNDKGREALVAWLAHSRKMGWDVYYLVQSAPMLDKQIRESFGEFLVICRRLDRINVPIIGRLGRALTFGLWSGRMPRVHMASVRYGLGPTGIPSETWVYRGHDLYGAYETTQRLGNSDCGLHSLVWYETPEEITQRTPRHPPKPKLRVVQLLEQLPADERIRHVQRLVRVGAL